MELTELNIKQVAAELGVHYMTASRCSQGRNGLGSQGR
jgi:hypothetical protein